MGLGNGFFTPDVAGGRGGSGGEPLAVKISS